MNLKIVLAQINRCSDKLRHGRPPSLWRSGDHVLALDAVQVGPSTTSLRAQRSNPESFRGGSLDCFVARAPRNDGVESARLRRHFTNPSPSRAVSTAHLSLSGSASTLLKSARACLASDIIM